MLRKRPLREFLVVLAALAGTCAPPAGASAEPATRLALGTIEPGKLADITVIHGNPLFDIVALSNVDVVIKDGVPYREAARLGPSLSAR